MPDYMDMRCKIISLYKDNSGTPSCYLVFRSGVFICQKKTLKEAQDYYNEKFK